MSGPFGLKLKADSPAAGAHDFEITLELPDGRKAKILVPNPCDDSRGWFWDERTQEPYGLNLVHRGHYA